MVNVTRILLISRFTVDQLVKTGIAEEIPVKAEEFIRRFLLHILPPGFMKIRYFGFLAHANKKTCIPLLRQLINPYAEITRKLTETVQEMMVRLTGVDITLCPECGQGTMVCVESLLVPLVDTS